MEWMVLAQFFPSNGIDGVEEEPVYGDVVDVLRGSLHLSFDEECLFHRVVTAKGKAKDWFLPGDVVCRRLGLDEERCDVLRKVQDKVFIAGSVDAAEIEGELESLRGEAIERHQWKVHRTEDWCAVIDAQGRALVVAYRGAYRQWRKVMEQLVPRQRKSKLVGTPSYRLAAAWCSLRAVHRRFMHEHDGALTRSDLLKSEYMVKRVYEHRLKMGRYSGSGRIIRMRKYRAVVHRPFWERCFRMMESGDSVPFAVRHVYEHPSTKWVAVSVDDAEWLLGCSWWSEWKGEGPVRFDKFKRRSSDGNRNWK